MTFCQLPDTWIHVPSKYESMEFLQIFRLVVIPPPKKTSKSKGVTSTLTSLQPRGRIAERSLTPYCSARARKFPASCQFFLWRAVSVLRDVKFPQFSHFCLSILYKTLKNTFWRPAHSSGVTLQNAFGWDHQICRNFRLGEMPVCIHRPKTEIFGPWVWLSSLNDRNSKLISSALLCRS